MVEIAGADDGSEAGPSGGRSPGIASPTRSVHAIRDTPEGVQTEPAVSVNVLCLLGAIVGIVSLFLPWCVLVDGPNELGRSLLAFMVDSRGLPLEPMFVAALMFITGTVVAFLFPAASAVQAAGVVLFLQTFMAFPDSIMGWHYELSSGFYAGILSSAMVLAGLLRPVGPGCDSRRPWWSRRTEVSSRADFLEGMLVRQSLAMPRETARALKGAGSQVYAAAVVISLVAGVLTLGLHALLSPDPVTSMDDGVKVIVGDAATFIGWCRTCLILTDGSSTVSWTWESVSFAEGHRTKGCETPVAYYGTQDLSGLVLGLTVVDVARDGYVTPGDMLYIVPSGDSSFAEGVSYRLTVSYIYTMPYLMYSESAIIYGAMRSGSIAFEFEGGEVASSSAEGVIGYTQDADSVWALLSVAMVALGSAILGVAYYVPMSAIRRRILAGRSRAGRPPKPPEQETDGGRRRPAHDLHGLWGRFLG